MTGFSVDPPLTAHTCKVASVCIENQSNGDKHDVCTLYGTCGYHIQYTHCGKH